ncbi:MAG: NAD(P)H-dependent oxidoreductase [Desulfocapsaceae bacterium]|nr:NAD(P)H-dependent oxidoreductase [Desulfocapsaceae bacterium]
MRILIVYWHPEPQSFNGALLRRACETFTREGHDLRVSNLLDMGFDPVSDRRNFSTVSDPQYFKQQIEEIYATENNGFSAEIEGEQLKIEWCDLMIWQFPLWWFGLPAVMKGWVDRVFAMGRTYGNGRFYESGVFRGKKAMLSLTTGGPREAYLPGGFNGAIDGILRPIQRGMLEFVGFSVLQPHIIYGPAHLDEAQRRAQLEGFDLRLKNIFNEEPITVGSY